LQTLRILWGAFLVPPFLFAIVFFAAQPEPQALDPMFPPLFAAIALGEMAFLAYWRFQHFGRTLGFFAPDLLRVDDTATGPIAADVSEAQARMQTVAIVGFAIAMSIVLYGFVLAFISGSILWYLPFALVGWVGILVQFPTRGALACLLEPPVAKRFLDEG
jgi:hypothetical protein